MDYENKCFNGDALEVLKTLPDSIVDCCVTSPPYYGLRDYGTATWVGGDPNCPHYRTSKISDNTSTGHKAMMDSGNPVGDAIYKTVCPLCGAVREDNQIGLEETPEEYIQKLVAVFHEVKRVLKDDGTLWVNIGDSYAGSGCGRNGNGEVNVSTFNAKQGTNKGSTEGVIAKKVIDNCKSKDLIGIPWMLAFALRSDGWYLRQDIIWHKPNPMPEPVRDRCTKSHEYIFLLSKNRKYYFDYEAIQEDSVCKDDKRFMGGRQEYEGKRTMGGSHNITPQQSFVTINEKRNKRDVWSVTTKAVKEAHFATYPEDLIEPCILAGSRVGGCVLDPFFGSGTTGRVAVKNNRKYIGIELNPEYIEISKRRTSNVQIQFNF